MKNAARSPVRTPASTVLRCGAIACARPSAVTPSRLATSSTRNCSNVSPPSSAAAISRWFPSPMPSSHTRPSASYGATEAIVARATSAAGSREPRARTTRPRSSRARPAARSRDDAGLVHDRDIRRLVAVPVGDPVLGSAEDAEQADDLDLEPALLLRLADGGLLGLLVGLDGTAGQAPHSELGVTDEQQPAVAVADECRGGREQQQLGADVLAQRANVRGDRHRGE